MLFSNISVSEVHISFTHTVKVRGARVDRERVLLYQSFTCASTAASNLLQQEARFRSLQNSADTSLQAAEPFFTALFTALLIGTWPSLRAWPKEIRKCSFRRPASLLNMRISLPLQSVEVIQSIREANVFQKSMQGAWASLLLVIAGIVVASTAEISCHTQPCSEHKLMLRTI